MRNGIAVLAALAATTLGASEPGSLTPPTGTLVEDLQCQSDPSQTYTLYLPTGYTSEKQWPALLVFDPRGRGRLAAEVFQEAAEHWGWIILSSDNTRSDGPVEPNLKAINALWPEVHLRYAADHERLYAAGFSGGGHVAYLLGKQTGELAGVIATGSRLLADHLQGTDFAVFACAGDRDFNFAQMRAVDEFVAAKGSPHRFEVFSGLHSWMPSDLAADAVAWMELVAMQRELRLPDEAAIGSLFDRDMAAARDLEASGDILAAMRRFEMVARTYDGLAEVEDAAEAAARLAASREVKRAIKEDRKWLSFESRMLQRFGGAYSRLSWQEEPMSAADLRLALSVTSLKKRASEPGLEGVTAQRLLATLYSQTTFYALRPVLEAENWQAAIALLTVATEVQDGSGPTWLAWYNLACAHSRARHRKDAIGALQRAVAEGFDNLETLQGDPDLAPLHGTEEFRAVVKAIEDQGSATPGW